MKLFSVYWKILHCDFHIVYTWSTQLWYAEL